ncbi:MAG: aminomethyl transferase family protein [Planctomycetes bacterium]|nr:aminomethyl transferase family protein [Planctomycetota bacterium]
MVFTSWLGCRVPAHFGDPVREYQHVQRSAGLFDRTYRGLVLASGRETTAFLDRMISSEVTRLAAGEGQPAAFLTPKGKLVGVFRVFKTAAEAFLLMFAEPLRPEFLKTCSKYAFLSDVQLQDASQAWAVFSVEGPRSGEVTAEVFQRTVPSPGAGSAFWEGEPVWIAPGGESPEGGVDLFVPARAAGGVWRALRQAAEKLGGGPVGREAAEILRLEAGVPYFGIDFTENNFPNEAGFEAALSYAKCYVGQEVVARMKTYGHANRAIRGVRFQGEAVPPAGAALRGGGSEGEAGAITSAVKSPRCGVIALAMLGRRCGSAGTPVTVQWPGGEAKGEVAPLPFVQLKSK